MKSTRSWIETYGYYLVVLIFIFGLYYFLQSLPLKSFSGDNLKKTVTILPQPKLLPADIQFINQDGKPFSIEQLKDNWTFLFFGYTSCPDVCPTEMAILKQVVKNITTQPKPQVVLVSTDPERDTPQQLKNFITKFNPNFIAVTAVDKESLTKLTKVIGIFYAKQKNSTLIDHSSTFILINPKAEYTALFSAPHKPKDIAKAYEAITKN